MPTAGKESFHCDPSGNSLKNSLGSIMQLKFEEDWHNIVSKTKIISSFIFKNK